MALRTKLVFSLFLISILSSCSKSTADVEGFIFGTFAGECFGDCVNIYKLTADKLWQDQNRHLPGSSFSGDQFDFESLSDSKYELVADFADDFPRALLEETDNQIGCPDCYDQGGVYIGWYEDGNYRSWTIDVSKDDIPEYLHDFLDQLQLNIQLLKQ